MKITGIYDLGEWFKTVEELGRKPEDWPVCPKCNLPPKLWLFDNGRFAACGCFGMYEAKPRAESINSFAMRHKGRTEGYGDKELIEAWAMWVDHGIVQNEMPDGQW